MSVTVTVWGTRYSATELNARMRELTELNREYGESDGRVTELNALKEGAERLGAIAEDRRRAAERPYVVLTRRYKDNGDCIKGRRTFKTRAAQQRYIASVPDDVAITYVGG